MEEAQISKGVMIQDSPYTHGLSQLQQGAAREVLRIGNSDAPTHIVCNECQFILAALYKRERTTEGRAPIS